MRAFIFAIIILFLGITHGAKKPVVEKTTMAALKKAAELKKLKEVAAKKAAA